MRDKLVHHTFSTFRSILDPFLIAVVPVQFGVTLWALGQMDHGPLAMMVALLLAAFSLAAAATGTYALAHVLYDVERGLEKRAGWKRSSAPAAAPMSDTALAAWHTRA